MHHGDNMLIYIKNSVRSFIKSKLTNICKNYTEQLAFTKPYIKRKHVEGVSFDFYIGDSEGMDWYDKSCTDPFWPELKIMKDLIIDVGDIVLDVGAHHGCTTICFSRWVGEQGRVFAVEPNPHNCDIITINLGINNIKNVTAINKAAGAEAGVGQLDIASSNSRITSNISKGTIDVDIFPLDELIDFSPNVLKLDVEGSEVLALRGAKKILETYPKLMIEVHKNSLSQFNTTLVEMMSLIDWSSYNCWVQWNGEPEILPYTFTDKNIAESMERMVHAGTHIFARPIVSRINNNRFYGTNE